MRKILLLLGLCLALVASASEPSQPATQTDVQQLQQQIQALDKDLTVHKAITGNRLDAQDKRVGDLGLWTSQQANHMGAISNLSTLVGIGITVLTALIAVGAGFITYFSTKSRVVEEAEKHAQSAAKAWFEAHKAELEQEVLDFKKQAADGKVTIKHQIDEFIETGRQLFSRSDQTSQQQASPDALKAVETASQALNAKPENDFTAEDHYVRGLNEFSAKRFDSALISFAKAIEKTATESVTPLQHSDFMFARAVTLGALNRNEEEIQEYDLIDQRYSHDDEPALREQVARALFNKGVTLGQLNRGEEASQAYDLIDQRYGRDNSPALRRQVAKALFNKGFRLGQLNRSEEEIQAYDLIDQRYSHDDEPALREQVARALFNKGVTLGHLNRSEEEIQVYDLVEQRYGRDDSPALREQVAIALTNKGAALGQLNRSEDAIQAYDLIDQRYSRDDEPALRKPVATALVNKGIRLCQLGRNEEAIQVYDLADQRYGRDDIPALREQVAKALLNKGVTLDQLNRSEEEIQVYDLIIQIYGHDESPTVRVLVAEALLYKGITLGELDRRDEAMKAYEQVIQQYTSDSEPKLKELVERANVLIIELQGDNGPEEPA